MENTRLPLEVLKIESPCPADWSRMTGDKRNQFCEHCQKHVHDLTQMTRSEAEELICRNAGNLCLRFARDQADTVVTLDYAAKPLRRGWTLRAATMALIAACASTLGISKPAAPLILPATGKIMPVYVLGEMMPFPQPPTTAPTTQSNPQPIIGEIAPR
jgi:hypothetical protein